jgi:hypothetical protein
MSAFNCFVLAVKEHTPLRDDLGAWLEVAAKTILVASTDDSELNATAVDSETKATTFGLLKLVSGYMSMEEFQLFCQPGQGPGRGLSGNLADCLWGLLLAVRRVAKIPANNELDELCDSLKVAG